jgi:hypothetical protein
MYDPAFERHPPDDSFATGDKCSLAQDRPILGFGCAHRTRRRAVDLALAYKDGSVIGSTKPEGRFGHGVQHRLQTGGRAADDLEYVAGRGLVFECLVTLGSAFGKLTPQIGYELLGIG